MKEIEDVEMAMAVLTHDETPFQLHMGIARGQVHIKKLKPRHGGIAAALHAFVAKVSKKIYPKNIYFISTPLPNMRQLLAEKLPTNAVSVGANIENSLIETSGDSPYNKNLNSL